jgi:hypothetical protein
MTRSLRLAQKIYANGSKLTASDLLSKEDYERERGDLLRLATQHRKQRRLRLDPSLCLVFETRFTAWLQIQEELRWLTRPSQGDVEEVLTRCNLVVPALDQLTATLFVDGGDNPASRYWMECVAANAFSIALRLSGRVLRGRSQESSGGVLAAVHTFIFQPTARCGPATEIIWGDNTAHHAASVSAMTRHALAQDLNPASNRNCFVVPPAVEGGAIRLTYPATGVGSPGLALPKYPPLRVVMATESETGGDSP